MTTPEEPKPQNKGKLSQEKSVHNIPTSEITVSPSKNRIEFGLQVEDTVLDAVLTYREGAAMYWNGVNVFGGSISLLFENLPTNVPIGPHGVLYLVNEDAAAGLQLNTTGMRMYKYKNLKGLLENNVLDVGDPEQIAPFIGVCARALEAGIPPEDILNTARQAQPQDFDAVFGRISFHEQKRIDFSRKLSERHFDLANSS